ncbi:MAG: hypothetical protein ACYCVL_06505 [Gemmatimonadaceae bacterium]
MDGSATRPRRWRWLAIIPIAIVLWLAVTATGRTARRQFFAALRIARPQGVSVTVPAFSGPTGSRRLQDAVAGMLADSAHVTREARDTTVADAPAAERKAGFAPLLPAARKDPPTLSVESARSITMRVNRNGLRTIFTEAGLSGTALPAAIDGATLTIDTPAAINARYGHCPVDEGQTLTNQIAQRPPASPDNGDCVILEQRPVVTAQIPPGLDMQQLAGVAVEVAGMSPNQARDFQQAVAWPAALALTMPRFIRSYQMVQVHGASAMLLNTAGRRGPTYDLLWTAGGRVYSLAGYGSSADAVPLANSMPDAGTAP